MEFCDPISATVVLSPKEGIFTLIKENTVASSSRLDAIETGFCRKSHIRPPSNLIVVHPIFKGFVVSVKICNGNDPKMIFVEDLGPWVTEKNTLFLAPQTPVRLHRSISDHEIQDG